MAEVWNERSGAVPDARRVLFVSFFYAPFSSIGGLRVSKTTRYLTESGWDIRVLTTDRDDLPRDLPVEVPEDRVHRAAWWDVNAPVKLVLGRDRVRLKGYEPPRGASAIRRLGSLYRDVTNFPDGQIGWYPGAVSAGERLLTKWRPDAIVSSALPGTAHLVARTLARRHHLPWIAEYRDPWTSAPGRSRRWPLGNLEERLERTVLRDACAIVTVSDAWADRYRRDRPGIPVAVIPNGFDAADYPETAPPSAPPLVLLYSGRLYDRQDVTPLVKATQLLASAGVGPLDVRIRFMGRYLGAVADAVRRAGGDPLYLEVLPAVPHRDALAAQRAAHALILVLARDSDVGWRPAKLYEYLGARRPIMVLGGTPAHEARSIVQRLGAGVAVDDAQSVIAVVLGWLNDLRAGRGLQYSVHPEEIKSYERRYLAQRYAEFIDRVLVGGCAGAQTPR